MLTTNAGVGLSLLADVGIDVIVVEHKDRFARFGFVHETDTILVTDKQC